ncbi:unnamed protein product [Cyprideis torosa]|uniref:Uncharacterized protein n=1 Tax=Cyprideis torosa TaxID=163714 RepID=A0A7R8VZT3_9CRUS|nr:unnamed protein product [Cyprideis torosa]CAG0878971.1 unnamed protein product [Cyprideis torosa]
MCTQLSQHPLQLTSGGFFPLNKGILAGIFSTVLTYLVVLLQFEIEGMVNRGMGSEANLTTFNFYLNESTTPLGRAFRQACDELQRTIKNTPL